MQFDISRLENYIGSTSMCKETHPNGLIHIYGYYSDSTTPSVPNWDDLNINCRGLILDNKGNVVERPFPKFWTFKQYLSRHHILLNDNQILSIPEGKFRLLEKIDGTMVCLYWINNKPFLSTQRSFSNIRSIYATKILYQKYEHLFSKIDRRLTYVFEAVYPETNVLIDYGNTRDLYLIGILDKSTGIPLSLQEIGFPICHDYSSEYSHIQDFNQLVNLNITNQEGFVVYFSNGKMMKIKFPWYQTAHHLLDTFFHQDKGMIVNYAKLCRSLGIIPPIISIEDVEQALAENDYSLYSIKNSVPRFYYLMGFEHWLNEVKKMILGEKDQLLHDIFKGTGLSLIPDCVFDFYKRIKQPNVYETIVWNWKNRYLKTK